MHLLVTWKNPGFKSKEDGGFVFNDNVVSKPSIQEIGVHIFLSILNSRMVDFIFQALKHIDGHEVRGQ